MNRRVGGWTALALFLLVAAPASPAVPLADDEAEIRALLEDFVSGWREADAGKLERVFASDVGTVMWVSVQDGHPELSSMTFAEVTGARRARPAYGVPWKIVSLDIVDARLAVAKLDVADTRGSVIDFMTLYKIGERWRIVNNAFAVQPERPFGAEGSAASAVDAAAIHQALEDYVAGWREGDPERLGQVFSADRGSIMWVGGEAGSEALQSMTFAAAIARGRTSPSYGLEWDVQSLDVVDDRLAMARLHISRSGGSYVDYLTLYKFGEQWRIVNKVFVSRSD